MTRDEARRSRVDRSHAAAVLALLVLASSLAGCLGGPSSEPVTTASEDTTSFTLDLSDIPDGSEWLLLEVVPKEPAHLRADLDIDATLSRHPTEARGLQDGPQDPEDACFVGQLGFGDRIVLSPLRYGAGASLGDPFSVTANSAWPAGQSQGQLHMMINDAEAGERVPVLFGLDEVDAWRDDVELSMIFEANATVDWRIADHGAFTCTTRAEDFQHGQHMQVNTGLNSPDPIHASDLSSTHEIEQRGVGFVFLQANLEYHAKVLAGGETTWEAQGEPGGSFDIVEHRLDVSQSPVEIQIPRLSSTDTVRVGYILLDLPGWAGDRFVEEPLEIDDPRTARTPRPHTSSLLPEGWIARVPSRFHVR